MITLLCSICSVAGVLTVASLAAITIHNDREEYKQQCEIIAAVKELKQAVDETVNYMEDKTK